MICFTYLAFLKGVLLQVSDYNSPSSSRYESCASRMVSWAVTSSTRVFPIVTSLLLHLLRLSSHVLLVGYAPGLNWLLQVHWCGVGWTSICVTFQCASFLQWIHCPFHLSFSSLKLWQTSCQHLMLCQIVPHRFKFYTLLVVIKASFYHIKEIVCYYEQAENRRPQYHIMFSCFSSVDSTACRVDQSRPVWSSLLVCTAAGNCNTNAQHLTCHQYSPYSMLWVWTKQNNLNFKVESLNDHQKYERHPKQ